MNEHDEKQLTVFRHFFDTAAGHYYRTVTGTSPTPTEIQLHQAERTREEFILAFGIFPDEATILSRAEAKWKSYDPSRPFSELSNDTRTRRLRTAKLELATFDEELYRRLADATARETIGVGLDGIRSDEIREGWVRAAEVSLHVPPRFWDESYLVQNERGMRAMLDGKAKT